MTDQELYNKVRSILFKTGSCKPNQWKLIKVADNEKVALMEAMQPLKGNIRIRKPFKKQGINEYNEQTYLFNVYRFTNKDELKFDCVIEDTRLEQMEALTI
ncbi:hypothetical protein [Rossellomorea marisflavi]|uniref:hypothetical protein n=1 Tax=Rossellomorea marisflavi TaxID=189381 RepID=UPI00345D5857